MIRFLFVALLSVAALFVSGGARAQAASPAGRFSVEVRGQGPDVILVPGLASSREVWADLSATLAATHRVHLLQVAGFAGEAARGNASGAVLAPLVDDIARYIAERKLEAPAVIGHSMGGATALALAARHPQSVGRVVVVDALPFFPLLFGPTVTAEQIRPRADAMRDATIAMSDQQFAGAQERTMKMLVKSDAHRPAAMAWSLASDRQVVARAMHELMTTDLRPELGRVRAQVMVLYASDAAGPFPAAQVEALYVNAYKDLLGAMLVRIDGASHFLMWDQPARVANAVGAFLDAR